jgi:protein-tyrosine phosphatase
LKKVLFVCTANICRSPMAETIFYALAKDRGLTFQVESAGTAALVGKNIAPNAVEALEEIGVYPGDHHARQVDEAMLKESDLILTMTPQHVRALREFRTDLGRAGHKKIYTLPEYATGGPSDEAISDPYGYTMSAYRSSVRQLLVYAEQLVDRLKE